MITKTKKILKEFKLNGQNLYIDASHPDETRIVLKSKLSIG